MALLLSKHALFFRRIREKIAYYILLLMALISVLALLVITLFLFTRGASLFSKVSLASFLFSSNWAPTADPPSYGIAAFIVASIFVTLLAVIIALPMAMAVSIYLAELAPKKIAAGIRLAVDILASIPSVIYGLFGIVVIATLVRTIFGGSGYSLLSASIVLAIMILPTIISISEVSIRAVPKELKEAALGLGSTHWEAIIRVLLPSAKSGIITAIVLGLGRALGETIAVLMVAGNAPIMPTDPLSKVRTLTMNVITDMSYATGDHLTSLFTTGMILFLFIIILNLTVQLILRTGKGRG